ncbi:4-hydroxy-tetrahydrodipicolinate synthase [bacterium]|nr:4-hydroxy-tetrahydrodipicolinate synthase [bacterium]
MFQGSMVAIVTPFKDGKIDEAGLRGLIEFQISHGTSAIVPCGTTGESATLSHEEHDRVVKISVDSVAGRVPIIAGTGSNSTQEAINLTKHARDAGADAALLITPYYNKPTQQGLYEHYLAVAEAVDFPIVLYNVPGRTAVNMMPSTVARLAEIENIRAVKEASGSLAQVSEIISLCGSKIAVLSGDDALTLPIMSVGGKGVISVAANIVPSRMADMVNAFLYGDWEKARDLHIRLFDLFQAMFYETNPIPVKTALAMMGMIEEELRPPLCKIGAENRERLKGVLTQYGIIS